MVQREFVKKQENSFIRISVKDSRISSIALLSFVCLASYFCILLRVAISPVFTILALAICAGFILLTEYIYGIGLVLFLLSFQYIFNLQYNSYSMVSILSVVVLGKVMWTLRGRNAIRDRTFVLFIAFVSYGVVQCVLLGNSLFFFFGLIVNLSLVCMVVFEIDGSINIREIKMISYCFALGVIVACITALMQDMIPNMSSVLSNVLSSVYYRSDEVRMERFDSLQQNPNYFSLDVTIAVNAIIITSMRQKKIKLIDIILVFLLLLFGIFSLSKSFLVSVAFSALLFVIYERKKIGKLIPFAIIIAILAGVLFQISKDYIFVFFERMTSGENANEMLSGRTDHWIEYADYLFSDVRALLFGMGYLQKPIGLTDAHSMYIEVFSFFGLAGGGILIALFLSFFSFWGEKRDLLHFFMLLVILFRGLAINMLGNDSYFYFIIIAVMLNCCNPVDYDSIEKKNEVTTYRYLR